MSTTSTGARVRSRVRVEGTVQGVGFRPFVYRLAVERGLTGFVGNDEHGVVIEVEGEPAEVAALVDALSDHPPPLALVTAVDAVFVPTRNDDLFVITTSESGGTPTTSVSPDVATCDDCLAELHDPGDRRYRYPFVNCTNCGPRFTIVRGVPYDRALTTMATFAMCDDCRREYDDPAHRRFHAQPVCCPDCGPQLALVAASGEPAGGDAIEAAARLLADGAVVAVKGLGGYHLAAAATDERAVATLRARKHREDKPFAVMVRDLTEAGTLVHLDDAAAALLASPARPIVLLPRGDGGVAPSVAPGNSSLGVLLPYTPVHHLLLEAVAGPIVLTSGNVSDEPIAYDDTEARERLAGIADAFLVHDRPIHVRTDDSVVRVVGGRPIPVRRSRGYAPTPLHLATPLPQAVLGCGAELKHTFTLACDDRAYLSHHIGDLENYETYRSFTDGVAHFARLFDVNAAVLAHDLHPEYLSTKYALERGATDDVGLVGVQHHHAHIASCLVDNLTTETVIGVAYDGLGYGTDGTLWGGEILLADLAGFTRLGHLAPVPLPGGTAAIREPWRMAAAWLDAAYEGAPPDDLDVCTRHAHDWDAVRTIARQPSTPVTSSVGRLFDAVAALCGVRDRVNYEGQAAIELEQQVDDGETGAYPLTIAAGDTLRLDGAEVIRAVVDDVRAGVTTPVIAARFHNGLIAATAETCDAARAATGVGSVALSGGVFQNAHLLAGAVTALEHRGFRVLVHSRVPPNDGGISLGQVAIAGARLR